MLSALFSVWRTEEGLFKRGKEIILILTNKRIAFVSKTKMSKGLWESELTKQVKIFRSSGDTVRVPKGYTLQVLQKDLEDENNMSVPMNQIMNIEGESKRWGSQLKIKFKDDDGKVRAYKFAVVRMWTRYPVKDALAFEDPNWQPWINTARSFM